MRGLTLSSGVGSCIFEEVAPLRRTAEDAAAVPSRRATGMRDVDASVVVVVVVAPAPAAASLAMLLRFRVELAMVFTDGGACLHESHTWVEQLQQWLAMV